MSSPIDGTPSKRARPNGDAEEDGAMAPQLDQFTLAEVLGNDADRKTAFLHLMDRAQDEAARKQAVVILEKKPFSDEDLLALLDPAKSDLTPIMRNDVYTSAENSALKATIIYPATRKHVEKYRRVDSAMVSESREDYERVVLPYITQSQFSTQWVENVLNGTAEKECVFYNDSDFLMAPDLQWDGKRLENFHVTAIVHQRGIKSIRDLSATHLPLLRNIAQRGKEAIRAKFDLPAPRLRVFVHYQPTYYHLHVHFVHVMHDAVGSVTGKAHLLDDIIDNIEMMPDYYQTKTLHYHLKNNNPLLERLMSAKENK